MTLRILVPVDLADPNSWEATLPVAFEQVKALGGKVTAITVVPMKAATIARHGTIYDEVLDVAEEIGADQIIMTAHRPNVSEYLLGNNADKIIRHAKCSVNVLRTDR